MKKFNLFRLLALFVVLIMSIPQMWAGKKTIYFDVQNISWWKNDDVVKVHAWGGAATEDVSMTVYSGNMLTCQINDDQTNVCFYRYYNSKWNEQTIDKTDAATKNCWTLWTSTSGSKQEISNGYEYEPTAGLMGGMNLWNAGTLSFDGDGNVSVDLTAGDTHQFKILDGTTWYSYNSYGFSTSATDFTLYTSNSECSITASTTGTYHFHWDRTNHTLCIFFPNDYAKARLTKTKYIYFDARNSDSDHWNQTAFASRFYFKYYDSGQDQSNTKVLASAALETSVYPVTVPDNDYVGRVQINRWSADGTEDWKNATSVIHAYTRSSNAENCIVIPKGQASSWTPSVEWTTYCPPISSATLSDNSTSVIPWTSGNGTSGNPYLVPASGTIKVSASATSAVPGDDNMTIKYNFKVSDNGGAASSNVKTHPTKTYDKGSLTNNHTYEVSLEAYNTYNGAEGTKNTSATHKWYKALTTYNVTHTISHVTKGGSDREGAGAAAYHLAYSATYTAATGYKLPGTITVQFGSTTKSAGTDYTWNSSTGALSIPADKIDGNVTITVTGVAKQAAITFEKYSGVDGDNGTTATYDQAMPTITVPHKIGYKFNGYFDSQTDGNGSGTQYYNANGTSARRWDKNTESATTLYAQWEEDVNNFKADAASSDWATGTNWSKGSVPNDWAEVHLLKDVVISSGTKVHIGQLKLNGGTLTINEGGVLEVASTITKEDGTATAVGDIIVNTSTSTQGALIFDNSAGTTRGTVTLTSKVDRPEFQYVAIPITTLNVGTSAFSGEGIYTFVWEEGKGWDRRGYYEDINAFDAVGLTQNSDRSGSYEFSGTLASTGTFSGTLSCTGEVEYKSGVNMFGNSWTAPIKINALNGKIEGSTDAAVHIYEDGSWKGYAPASATDDKVIPSMQAYAILAAGTGSIEISYDAVRAVASANRNSALRAPQRQTSDVLDHMTISVTTNERKIDLDLYENAQFSERIDKGWEAIYMEGDGRFGELYAQADEKMSILATPNLEGTVLGFVPGAAESYTISFEGDGRGYYLNDVKLGKSTLIDEANTYEFASDESMNATRFVISRTPLSPTGIEDIVSGSNARKQMIDGSLYIIRDGKIYDVLGKTIK